MKRFWFKLGLLGLAFTAMAIVVPDAWAQSPAAEGLGEFARQAGFGGTADIRLIIGRLIRSMLVLVGVVLVVLILYGGALWMMAGGAADKITKARAVIVNAIVGLLIVFASFAITQFVVSSLVRATSSSVTDGGGPGLPGCPTCPVDVSDIFVAESWGCLEDFADTVPRNAVIQVAFNRNVVTNAEYLTSFITVQTVPASPTPVPVSVSGSGQVVTIAPTTPCPDGDATCFEEGTNYVVQISEGFESASPSVEIECSVTAPCSFEFKTTGVVDFAAPVVTLNEPDTGDPVYAQTALALQATIVDNSGVGITVFEVDGSPADSASPEGCDPVIASCVANGEWTPGNLVPGSGHSIVAVGSDCAGNTAESAPVVVIAYGGFCANGIWDENLGEEDVDCGGDCPACNGASCVDDSECSSLLCVDGECVTGPRIDSVVRGDGAPGNYVTISGTGFGTTPGSVVFMDIETTDEVPATIVSCPNPAWTPTQVVVSVPVGAEDGPLRLTTAGESPLSDATDDDFGFWIEDFDVNDVVRPGLCTVNPPEGLVGDAAQITGAHFGADAEDGTVYFSNALHAYEANFLPALDTWLDAFLNIRVPASLPGDYDLEVFVDGEGSNPLDFTITDPGASLDGPVIQFVNSGVQVCAGDIATEGDLCGSDTDCGAGSCEEAFTSGSEGQYVTIVGTGFGFTVGEVVFTDGVTGEEVTFIPAFPAACELSWWTPTQIVAAVPDGMSLGISTIHVSTAEPTAPESNAVEFSVIDAGVTPGLCALSPSSGPTGTDVSVFGSNLGLAAAEVSVSFNGVEVPSVDETYVSSQEVRGEVPVGAATGPVQATVNGLPSNTITFTVGNCQTAPDVCSAIQVCCATGVCAASIDACEAPPALAQYAYAFSTGPIPTYPTVVEACNGITISPSPSTRWDDGAEACVNAVVNVTFNPGVPATSMSETAMNSSTVVMYECSGSGVDPCESVVADPVTSLPLPIPGDFLTNPLGFVFDPYGNGNLDPDTWYVVTVGPEIPNNMSVEMVAPYQFRFHTRANTTPCEISGVMVQPADYTAETTDLIAYSALPTTDGCLVLDPDGYYFDWSLNAYGKDIHFIGTTSIVGDEEVLIQSVDPISALSGGFLAVGDTLSDMVVLDPTVGPLGASALQSTIADALALETVSGVLPFSDEVVADGNALVTAIGEHPTLPTTLGALVTVLDDQIGAIEAQLLVVDTLQPVYVEPLEETSIGQSALVTAAPEEFSVEDTEELTVRFTDPAVTEYFPSCNTACINAAVGAVFNTPMVLDGDVGLTGGHINPSTGDYETNVRLFQCANELCQVGNTEIPTTVVPTADPEMEGREFTLLDPLPTPNRYYRVTIWGGVESVFGQALWGDVDALGNPVASLNDGAYYSWVFHTRESAALCGIGNVEIEPAEMILSSTGASGRTSFTAQVFGDPDTCALSGQRLNAAAYPWSWEVFQQTHPLSGLPVSIAEFLPGNTLFATLDTDSALPDWCTTSCLNAGSPSYSDICGNTTSITDTDASGDVFNAFEDCDPPDGFGCSASCLTIGVPACADPSNPGCCGNQIKEGREECDDGNNLNGDGCSSECLNEGSRAIGVTCGDGEVTQLIVSGTPSGTVYHGGEECDDGNVQGGDGCSAVCLHEGTVPSVQVYARCGLNGIEPGEDCDDGNLVSGDGCSPTCLSEELDMNTSGVWSFGALSGTCGDGFRQYAPATGIGEECDGEDGCSSTCRRAGSSIFHDTASFCGDGLPLGSGEECEYTGPESDDVPAFDPVQYLEIAPEAASAVVDGLVTTTVEATGTDSATTTSADDTSVIGLSCSCTGDASCGNTTAIGCGLNGCCFERPEVDENETVPLPGPDVCRNTLVQVQFTQEMDPNGLFDRTSGDPLIVLELVGVDENQDGVYTAATEAITDPAACPSTYTTISRTDDTNLPWWQRVFRRVVRVFRPQAFAASVSCVAPVELSNTLVNIGTPDLPEHVSEVTVRYENALEPFGVYRIVVAADDNSADAVAEGVTNVWNVTMLGDGPDPSTSAFAADFSNAWLSDTFITGPDICRVSYVAIEDLDTENPGLFTASGETHTLRAQAYHVDGSASEPIVSTPAYAWSWSGVDAAGNTWGWNTSVNAPNPDIVALDPVTNIEADAFTTIDASTAPAGAINGEEIAYAGLRIETSSFGDEHVIRTGTLPLSVFLCENPWPSVGFFPFRDTAEYAALISSDLDAPDVEISSPFTGFSFAYCRDALEANNVTDDLPDLSVIQTPGSQSEDVFKELLFPVEGLPRPEALGVRVASNVHYEPPEVWFENQDFVGAPAPETLDGFSGVRDERTLYISAPNLPTDTLNSSKIYPNMYAVAYSEGATESTQNIYGQMLESWSFLGERNPVTNALTFTNNRLCTADLNGSPDVVEVSGVPVACSSDLDCADVLAFDESGTPLVVTCAANKDKLRRDLRRLEDARQMVDALEAYGDNRRHCSVTKGQACFDADDCPGTETCLATVPPLEAGTYVPSRSWSAWPSWSAQFGNTLGTALPVDPLNLFADCGEGYDGDTCYNELTSTALCPFDSHVYQYQSIAAEEYVLRAEMEFGVGETSRHWAYSFDYQSTTDVPGTVWLHGANQPKVCQFGGDETDGEPCQVSSQCTGSCVFVTGAGVGFEQTPFCQDAFSLSATSGSCGDGILGAGEVCEVGNTTTAACQTYVCSNVITPSLSGAVCDPTGDIVAQCGAGGSCNLTNGVRNVPCFTPPSVNACNGYDSANTTSSCVPFACGNGIFEPAQGEQCDDGSLNGQYGFCGANCTLSSAIGCGDASLAGGEVCDCGNNILSPLASGCTTLNGLYNLDASLGCAFNCSGPPPFCGDDVIQSAEVCDGDYEVDGRALCADGTPCSTSADCSDNSVCGSAAPACGLSASGRAQARTRACTTSCAWPVSSLPGGWDVCQEVGECGDGNLDAGEACDDGAQNSNSASCKLDCTLNVCGDGDRLVGVESCDLGSQNGEPCVASYNSTCNFCTNTCTYQTLTGPFCGNGSIDAGEYCDGSAMPKRCFKESPNPANREVGDVCTTVAECPTDGTWYCSDVVGVCNGGSREDQPSFVYNGAPCLGNTANGNRACGQNLGPNLALMGTCVVADCNTSCSASCPFSYNEGAVLVQAEGNSQVTDSANLYSYLSGENPDTANVYFPACGVGVSLSGDINYANVEQPFVDILFMLDLSGSMNDDVDDDPPSSSTFSGSRLSIAQAGLNAGLVQLFDVFEDGHLDVAIGSFNGYINNTWANTAINPSPSSNYWYGTNIEFTDNLADLTAMVNSLTAGSGTPTANAFDWAEAYMEARRLSDPAYLERVQVVVVLMDGGASVCLDGTQDPPGNNCGTSVVPKGLYLEALEEAMSLRDSGVQVYTATFNTSLSLANNAEYYSSNACSWTATSTGGVDQNGCTIEGTNYAYRATTAVEFNQMIEDIINSISSITFNFLTPDGPTTAVLEEGLNRQITLPSNFSCPANGSFVVPLQLSFNGEGTVEISNLNLEYCPN